jgi:hypothetical protein
MTNLIAWIPFVEPLPAMVIWWPLLLIPLSLGISMIYKALRVPNLDHYPREVAIMTTQIIVAMIALSLALILLVQIIIPAIPAD